MSREERLIDSGGAISRNQKTWAKHDDTLPGQDGADGSDGGDLRNQELEPDCGYVPIYP